MNVPIRPTNEPTKFFIEANGLIRARHRGFGVFLSFLFFSNYNATPVPIDLPMTIILVS